MVENDNSIEVTAAKAIIGIDLAPLDDGEYAETEKKFEAEFVALSNRLEELKDPEIQAKTLRAAKDLIHELKIRPELFNENAPVVLMTAIAKRLAERGETSQEEQVFAFDAATLLAKDFSDRYEEIMHEVDKDDIDAIEQSQAYDKYTDKELSERLLRAMPKLVAEVQQNLQIDEHSAQPFTPNVLKIEGRQSDISLGYLKPPGGIDPDSDEYLTHERYVTELQESSQGFAEAIGSESNSYPVAWAIEFSHEDTIRIVLPHPEARLLLEPESRNNHFRTIETHGHMSDESDILSVLKHEYAHTQKNIRVGLLGVTLEELRADFAVNKGIGYGNEKRFARFGFYPATGFNLKEYLTSHQFGADKNELYEDIANATSLNTMLELSLITPSNIYHGISPALGRVNEYLGGWNAFTERLFAATEDKEIVLERFDAYVNESAAFFHGTHTAEEAVAVIATGLNWANLDSLIEIFKKRIPQYIAHFEQADHLSK